MDLSLPLMGVLGLIGYNINNRSKSRESKEKRDKIPSSEIREGKTIYESKDYVMIKNKEQEKLNAFYKDKNTIISTNRYNVTTNKLSPGGKNKTRIVKPNTKVEILNNADKIYAGPMFKEGGYYTNVEVSPKELKENFDSDISELSGLKTDFTHKNMQPYFGSNVKNHVDGVSILDKYNGRNFIEKKEVELDNPTNKQTTTGMKAYTELIDKSRFQVGRIMNNVLPFKQYKEPPIPQELARGTDKNIDQLRALNNPKISLKSLVNHGSGNYKRPIDPNFVKNKTDTTYEGDFNGIYPTFTKNLEEGYIPRRDYDIKYTQKSDLMETEYKKNPAYIPRGDRTQISADGLDKTASYYPGSSHFEMANDWVRNLKNPVPLRDEKIQNTYVAYEQERETTNRETFGNVHTNTGDTMRSLDKAKTTNKELTIYSYTPTPQSQIEKAPVGREFYNKASIKTKPSIEYYAGGVKKFAPQSNKSRIAQRSKVTFEDYTGPVKMNNIKSPAKLNIGKNTVNRKHNQMETDFTYRIG